MFVSFRGVRISRRMLRGVAVAAIAATVSNTGAWANAMPAERAPSSAAVVKPSAPAPRLGTQKVTPIALPSRSSKTAVATATKWPGQSSANLSLSAGSGSAPKATATGSPVWAQPVAGKGGTYNGPSSLQVSMQPRALATQLGISGVVWSVGASGGTGAGRVRVGLDYSSFAQVYGGNYGLRLHLVQLPACALTTPQLPACRVQTPLASANDAKSSSVSAMIALGGGVAPASGRSTVATGASASGAVYSDATGSTSKPTVIPASTPGAATVLGATDSTGQEGGQGGTYAQDGLSSAGSWAGGGSSGDFTYTYSIALPGSSSSLAPNASLSYDSGSVDGKTSNTQAQSSWVGDGWASQDSYVEQNFVPCDDNPEGSAGSVTTMDECYNGKVLTLSLNGSSTSIVYDASLTGSPYRVADDNGATVNLVTSSGNGTGTYDTSYWVITERDGTQYYFGRNQLPGWASGKPTTNSVDYERVYAAHSGDPCFSSSYCVMAYKWHLDYVVDAKSEAMAYYYAQDPNYYGANGGTTGVKYIRDSHLDHIDYGFTTTTGPYGTVPDSVVYTPTVRCTATDGSCGSGETTSNAASYPDVPFDLECASGASCSTHAPSFFSTVRLSTITTEQYSTASSKLVPVDIYALTQSEPSTGDKTSATLWLAQIQRKGEDFTAGGSASELPLQPVQFASLNPMPNRVDTTMMPSMYRFRITQIENETGGTIGVTYGTPVPCTAAWVEAQTAATASSDTKSCYPVYWTPSGASSQQLDWFEKYAVTRVMETDTSGGSPPKETDYSYTSPAWHYDDDESVKAKYRTYGQFRGYQSVTTNTGTPSNDAPTKQATTYYQGMDGDYLSPTSTRSVSLPDSQGGSHTDSNQLAGKVLESTSYLGNSTWIDHSTISSYWVSAATATRTRTGLPALSARMTGTAETWSEQRLSDGGETNAWRINETDTTYDATASDANFGLTLYSYQHTVPVNAAYDRCTGYTYAPQSTVTPNLTGLATLTEVDSVACSGFTEGSVSSVPSGLNTLTAPSSSLLVRPDDVVSATETYYDGASSITATPTLGEPTTQLVATGYAGGAWVWRTKAIDTYDAYGRVLTSKDGNNTTTTTTYTLNTAGLTTAVSVTNALSQTTSKTLDPTRGLELTSTDINGVVTTDWYDALGRMVDEWDDSRATGVKANKINTYTVSNTGVSSVVTQTMNEETGAIYTITIVDALGRTRQVQTSSAAGTGTRLISDTLYDTRGWVAKKNNAYADPNSAPTLAIAPLTDGIVANQDDYVYDGLGRVVYDNSMQYGNLVSTTTTVYNGDATTTIPPIAVVPAGATTAIPLTGGAVKTTRTDPLGRTSEVDEYTANPSLTTPSSTSTGIFYVGGGTPVPTTYAYDAHGNQYKTTDSAGHTWTSTYDLAGEALSKSDPTAGTTTLAYDNDGNLTQSLDARGDYVSYTYDALNRKTGQYNSAATAQSPYVSSTSPGNQTASWVYDNSNNAVPSMTRPLGHLTTESSYANNNAYTNQRTGFNVFGESAGEKTIIPSVEGSLAGSYSVTHTYSANTGLLLSDTYASNGVMGSEIVQHGYAGQLDMPDGLGGGGYGYAQSVLYDAWSRPQIETIGSATNGLATITNTYDVHTGQLRDQLVKRAATATPATVDETAYEYDLPGNITRQTETRLGSNSDTETQCFTYDTLDRLTTAWSATDNCTTPPATGANSMVGNTLGTNSAYWTSWTLDDQGNRRTQTQHALPSASGGDTTTTYTYSTTANGELNSTSGAPTGSTSYHYDPSGNMDTRTTPTVGSQGLTWDNTGKLTKITGGSAGETDYVYDADGNLLLQKDPTATVLYLQGQQITLTGSVKTAIRYYPLPGGGTVVRTGTGTSYNFEITDEHGTATLYVDHTAQTPTWRQFDPYGNPRGTTTPWIDNRTFLNKTTDTTTGLTNIGARYYDPTTGRFVSLDPVFERSDPEALNGYGYTDANPVTETDPSGLMACGDSGQCRGNPDQGGEGPPSSPPPPSASAGTAPQTFDNLGGLLISRSDPRYSRFKHLAELITRDAASYGAVAPAMGFMNWDAYCEAHVDFCGNSLITALHSELYDSHGQMIGRSAYGDAIMTGQAGPNVDFSAILKAVAPIAALVGVVVSFKVGNFKVTVDLPDSRPFSNASSGAESMPEQQASEISESAETTSNAIEVGDANYQLYKAVAGTGVPDTDFSHLGITTNNGLSDGTPSGVFNTTIKLITNPKGILQAGKNMLGFGDQPSQWPEGEEEIK